MSQFEVHIITACNEDLGVMPFDNGELAIYSNKISAKRVADGMNLMQKIKGCGIIPHEYVVVQRRIN